MCKRNLIYVPFTPVIILFCHVVETADGADLERLGAFAESLRPVCAASDAVAKLYRVCAVLHSVAGLCLRARAAVRAVPDDHDMAMVGDNIDMYLSQLGFMPQVGAGGGGNGDQQLQESAGGPFGAGEGNLPAAEFGATGQASELANWFSGNTHILGLLEEDLSEFEPRMWSIGGQ